jgi:hypothetical protein
MRSFFCGYATASALLYHCHTCSLKSTDKRTRVWVTGTSYLKYHRWTIMEAAAPSLLNLEAVMLRPSVGIDKYEAGASLQVARPHRATGSSRYFWF